METWRFLYKLTKYVPKEYFVTRQLPSLETISNPIEDEHVRNKLSTMSFKEYHPLLKRIIDPTEQQQQRRHSIANIIEPEYKYSAPYPIPYSAPSTPPYHQHQSSPHYFYAKDPMRRNSMATMATGRRDSSNRITALILSEDENNISRRASTSSISSSSSSLVTKHVLFNIYTHTLYISSMRAHPRDDMREVRN